MVEKVAVLGCKVKGWLKWSQDFTRWKEVEKSGHACGSTWRSTKGSRGEHARGSVG